MFENKEEAQLKQDGLSYRVKGFYSMASLVINKGYTLHERNDGWYAVFDARGERSHCSISPQLLSELKHLTEKINKN